MSSRPPCPVMAIHQLPTVTPITLIPLTPTTVPVGSQRLPFSTSASGLADIMVAITAVTTRDFTAADFAVAVMVAAVIINYSVELALPLNR